MDDDTDTQVEDALQECDEAVVNNRRLFIAAIVIVCVSVLAISVRYFQQSWVPFDQGIASTNIVDYPQAVAEIQQYYPQPARFLPSTVPQGAMNIVFDTSTLGALQASPWLFLEFDLNEEDAQVEIARLKSFAPTDVVMTGFMPDPIEKYNPSQEAMVFGFLELFIPDYPNKIVSPSDLVACVIYEPKTRRFIYEFNSD